MSRTDAPADPLALQSDDDAASEARRASHTAVRLLSKRDHCTGELRQKLEARGFNDATVDSALEDMASNGYLDDERFAQLFAEQRMEKGLGPRGIDARLRERGVDASLARRSIEALDVDWQEVACAALCKRFSDRDLLSEETRQLARMARFLESRGFSSSDSIRAIERARQSAREA